MRNERERGNMESPKVRVFGARVLVARKEVASVSGIILAEARSLQMDEGVVVKTGPDVGEFCDVMVGDVVVWGRYAEGQVNIENNKFVILNAGDLIYAKES